MNAAKAGWTSVAVAPIAASVTSGRHAARSCGAVDLLPERSEEERDRGREEELPRRRARVRQQHVRAAVPGREPVQRDEPREHGPAAPRGREDGGARLERDG